MVVHVRPKLFVNFFESLALGLDHEEYDEEHVEKTYQSEEEKHRSDAERGDGAREGYRNCKGE